MSVGLPVDHDLLYYLTVSGKITMGKYAHIAEWCWYATLVSLAILQMLFVRWLSRNAMHFPTCLEQHV